MSDSGDSGYLERDGKRIYLVEWELHDDNSLKLCCNNTNFIRDKKRKKPILRGTNIGYCVNEGTKISLNGGNNTQDRRTTLSGEIPCKCYSDRRGKNLTEIEFDDVSQWSFSS